MDSAQFNVLVGLGSVGLQVGAVVLLALFFMRGQREFEGQVAFVTRRALSIAFLLTFLSALIALTHEHVFGLEPCYWCWWQRIFIFPQILLFGMALFREKYHTTAIDASVILSVIGAGIALYHHTLQMYPGSGLPCPSTGTSCAQITYLEFGYITYPMMALSLFAFVFVLMLFARRGATK
jgi:disulfide bond formation protein DsbB